MRLRSSGPAREGRSPSAPIGSHSGSPTASATSRPRRPSTSPLVVNAAVTAARMAQQLWLLRHGDAEPHDTRPDPERRLTPRGERQAVAAGHALRALGVEFTAAFTSPRVRAAD